MKLRKQGSKFTNEQGKVDIDKLLKANPRLLGSFFNKSDEDSGDEGGSGGMATATLNALAAIAHADGRPHYAPSNAQSQNLVKDLTLAAEIALELSSGLGISPGSRAFPDHQYPSGVNPNAAKLKKNDSNNKANKSEPPKKDPDQDDTQ